MFGALRALPYGGKSAARHRFGSTPISPGRAPLAAEIKSTAFVPSNEFAFSTFLRRLFRKRRITERGRFTLTDKPAATPYQRNQSFINPSNKGRFRPRRSPQTRGFSTAESTPIREQSSHSRVLSKHNESRPLLSRRSRSLLISSIGGALLGVTTAYAPFMANTREGIRAAWLRKRFFEIEANMIASTSIWQYWMNTLGFASGVVYSRARLGQFLSMQGKRHSPYRIPTMLLGGILGSMLGSIISRPIANVAIFLGRVSQFAWDGVMADFMGKPHDELIWVVVPGRSRSRSV